MTSVAEYQFPRIKWRNEERMLWNPILKKTFKNRPEERVRLRIIEFLLAAGWSKNRISVEEKVRVEHRDHPLRTDIICYSREFDPILLVECKAEYASISEKVALQSARYNRSVQAPFLLLTNGRRDFWFSRQDRDQPEKLNKLPEFLDQDRKIPERNFPYWAERGFAGKKASAGLRRWLETTLNDFWSAGDADTTYLSFENNPTDLDLAHYFGIVHHENFKTAIGFLNTEGGGSRIATVTNDEGRNSGIVVVNLDLLSNNNEKNSILYTKSRTEEFNAAAKLDLHPDSPTRQIHRNLPQKIVQYLNNNS